MVHFILAVLLASFILGAAALAFALVLERQRPGRLVRLVKYSLFFLTIIAFCNGADFYIAFFMHLADQRIRFLTMNFLVLSLVASLTSLFLIVEEAFGRPFSPLARRAFCLLCLLMYFACLFAALFHDASGIDADAGFFISAMFAAVCIIAAGLVSYVRARKRYPERKAFLRRLLVAGFLFLSFDAGSELGWWHSLFGFPSMAMSPFFLVIMSVIIIRRCLALLSVPASGPVAEGAVEPDPRWELSARERDVFVLLAAGLENAEISGRLFISPHTVKNHVSSMYRKAGAKNRLDLMRLAGQPAAPAQPAAPGSDFPSRD